MKELSIADLILVQKYIYEHTLMGMGIHQNRWLDILTSIKEEINERISKL